MQNKEDKNTHRIRLNDDKDNDNTDQTYNNNDDSNHFKVFVKFIPNTIKN